MLDGLPQVMWFIRRHMRRHRTRGLSVPQFRALVLIDRFPEASLSAIAEHLGSTLPSASRLMTGLVDKGLVVRESATDDRRRVTLLLTPRGKSVLSAAQTVTQDAVAAKVADLTDAQRATIAEAMGLLTEIFANVRDLVRDEEPVDPDEADESDDDHDHKD
jgi:DNA-binding MarR family transcriptional regulator